MAPETEPQPKSSALAVNFTSQFKLQLSRNEAAQLLGISVRLLDRRIAEKQIVPRRDGRRVLFTRDMLNSYIKHDHKSAVTQ